MRQSLLLSIFLTLATWLPAQTGTDSLSFSLLTYSPTPEVSGAFGHSAIRVRNFTQKTDRIYNWGIYDFNTPNFLVKFLRGKLMYQMGRSETAQVIRYHRQENNRLITERPFNLPPQAKRKLLLALEENYRPENRKYLYDFFYDNCATRILDINKAILGDDLVYGGNSDTKLTFRQLLDLHVKSRPWTDFGMDLLLGLPADQTATYDQQMFLPYLLDGNMAEGLAVRETIQDSSGVAITNETPLLGGKSIFMDGIPHQDGKVFLTPFVVFSILCLFALTLTLARPGSVLLRCLDGLLFFTLGVVGWVLLLMWFATDHSATQWNLNVLWANPLYLPLFNAAWSGGKEKRARLLYGVAFASSVFLLLCWTFFPQQYHIGVLPILLMMLVRSYSAFARRKSTRI